MGNSIFDEELDNGTNNARKSQLLALSSLLKDEFGRSYIYGLLSDTGVFRNTHLDCQINNAYENGRKSIGYDLIDDIKQADFNLYLLMIKENQKND